ETIVEEDLIKDTEFEQISYYPNPVREELYVKWANNINNPVTALEVYSLTGQLLRSYTNLKDVEMTSVAFQDYPIGYYNLLLVYADGERKLLKIVKQ
ncbi:MAG: T9SS type A sorting domain-containing protein, partial [Flavobacterium sp.]